MKYVLTLFIGLLLSFNMIAQGLENIDRHKYVIDTVASKDFYHDEFNITVYKCIYHGEIIKEVEYIKTDSVIIYSNIEINKNYKVKILESDGVIRYINKIKRRDNTYHFF